MLQMYGLGALASVGRCRIGSLRFAQIALVALLLGAVVLTGCNNEGSIETEISGTPASERISALEMLNLYQADEKAAQQRFYGKVVEVTGTVESRGTLQAFDGDEYTNAGRVELASGVSCTFASKHGERIDSYRKGDSVVMRGRVDDFDPKNQNLRLRGCSFVE